MVIGELVGAGMGEWRYSVALPAWGARPRLSGKAGGWFRIDRVRVTVWIAAG